jgi:hypothetical protein
MTNDLNGRVDCSKDVISCQTSKSIKGGGGASFTLVPRRNYINYIYPNDWVNIWFNPGDGRGFVRTFFGFIDRIQRDISTNDDGGTSTFFNITCSDFTKAFDATQVYFNPHVADRDDFVGQFAGTKNLAGAQLRTKGITVYGTPADIVLNFTTLLLGFGSQFMVPPKYPVRKAAINASRELRRRWVRDRLPKKVQEAIGDSTIKEWEKSIKEQAQMLASRWQEEGIKDEQGNPLPLTWNANRGFDALMALAQSYILAQKELPENTLATADIKTGKAVEAVSVPGTPEHLLDLLDLTFMEYLAIDGSIVSAPIWTQQGTLWSMMNAYSNSIVNELFCDLRPLSKGYTSDTPLIAGGYAREPDEHDLDEFGVRFVPAMVMREYPFSTIDSVDYSNIEILNKPVNKVYVGSIFSKEPNKPGRKIYIHAKALHDYIAEINPNEVAIKHLDVAVLSVRDIITESIGRSDHDVVNLIELYSDGFMGKHMKYLMQDIQPIAVPVSVARHGLRVRTYSTRFARFSKKQTKYSGVDNRGTRHKLVRWLTLLDHWYQHNIEYLNGTISTRAFPEIRVGYRLDIRERRESYYVEGVNHSWSYPNAMTSSFTLSRGQRNDPYPIYVKPHLRGTAGQRDLSGRLADSFKQRDPTAVLHDMRGVLTGELTGQQSDDAGVDHIDVDEDRNFTDIPDFHKDTWGSRAEGYLAAGSDETGVSYVALESWKGTDDGPLSNFKLKLQAARKFAFQLTDMEDFYSQEQRLANHPAMGLPKK